ncbi:MAG: tRNA (N6-isopentenyl adenosine(37)-C2)-methylthiotransferase MiaB [Clostridium sp.]|nr:tRNA (N6-isopentenyl adenosine(37)-C2)-methylthiotransferase MiaB [Clostridium sp.]
MLLENVDYAALLRELLSGLFVNRSPLAYVRTYGCQGNVSDGERLQGMLEQAGFGFAQAPEEADFVLLNTCAVREHAQVRVFGNVGALKPIKAKKKDMRIAVCGCMVQQEGVAKELCETFPFVDLVFGTHALPRLPQMLYELYSRGKRIIDVANHNGTISEGLPQKRDSSFRAWLPISYGCDNFCTYCVVPHVRGRERSREPGAVLEEAKRLVADGYKDITLLGQNVNSYGKGLEQKTDFPSLLRQINAIEGDFRIRFMTSHPKDCSAELLYAMRDCRKSARHLHLPVQSGNNQILAAMNRRYTREDYLRIAELAKELMPELTLTSDIIVGFPGETDAQFRDTLDLVRRVEYGALFTFIYSPRVGTPAAALPDPIPREKKVARLKELCRLQEDITQRRNAELVGKSLRVLVEGERGEGLLTGRLESNAVVEFEGNKELIGQFAFVEITKGERLVLKAQLCGC